MRKIESSRGFTTAEMLFTALILSLSMMLLAQGALTIQRIYSRTLAKADAQMILSQVETLLRDDLSLATQYKTGTDNAADALTEYYKSDWRTLWNEIEEQFDAQKFKRFENLSIQSGDGFRITRSGDGFEVYNLRVAYTDRQGKTTVVAGSEMMEGVDEKPQFVIRSLNEPKFVKSGA